jgi:hypothetical protein
LALVENESAFLVGLVLLQFFVLLVGLIRFLLAFIDFTSHDHCGAIVFD